MTNKIEFSDGYIEENASGYIYVGAVAHEVMAIIRKTKCTLAEFKEVYEKQIASIK